MRKKRAPNGRTRMRAGEREVPRNYESDDARQQIHRREPNWIGGNGKH